MKLKSKWEQKHQISLSIISEIEPVSEAIQSVVDEQFINQLKADGLHDQFSAKQPIYDPDGNITGFFFLLSITQVNLSKLMILKTFGTIYRSVHNL